MIIKYTTRIKKTTVISPIIMLRLFNEAKKELIKKLPRHYFILANINKPPDIVYSKLVRVPTSRSYNRVFGYYDSLSEIPTVYIAIGDGLKETLETLKHEFQHYIFDMAGLIDVEDRNRIIHKDNKWKAKGKHRRIINATQRRIN